MSYKSRVARERNPHTNEDAKEKPFFSKAKSPKETRANTAFFQASKADAVQRLSTPQDEEEVSTNDARMKNDKLVQRAGISSPEKEKEKNQGAAKEEEDKSSNNKKPGSGATAPEVLSNTLSGSIQRDLAIEPSNPDAQPQDLTAAQIREAIQFNNARYSTDSIRIIQDVVGATVTGTMDEETINLVVLYQAQNDLTADGKIGPITFNQMTDELAAEGVSDDTCLTSFFVGVRTPMEIHAAAAPNTANIFGHFNVDIQFSPHCNCADFVYRQFISGNVTLNGVNINNQFSIPPGNVLPATGNFVEDGNTTMPNNGRYGHRVAGDNRGPLNQYLDASGNVDMLNGCRFRSFDEPGVVGAPANTGDTYVFDFRFIGEIRRRGQMVERKFWSVRETIVIP
jgi:peptidoglycan hydrolase-like protein with peptidoglycan-binding domain